MVQAEALTRSGNVGSKRFDHRLTSVGDAAEARVRHRWRGGDSRTSAAASA
jgi:hypothetical protein